MHFRCLHIINHNGRSNKHFKSSYFLFYKIYFGHILFLFSALLGYYPPSYQPNFCTLSKKKKTKKTKIKIKTDKLKTINKTKIIKQNTHHRHHHHHQQEQQSMGSLLSWPTDFPFLAGIHCK